jgi:hypothetical protein
MTQIFSQEDQKVRSGRGGAQLEGARVELSSIRNRDDEGDAGAELNRRQKILLPF